MHPWDPQSTGESLVGRMDGTRFVNGEAQQIFVRTDQKLWQIKVEKERPEWPEDGDRVAVQYIGRSPDGRKEGFVIVYRWIAEDDERLWIRCDRTRERFTPEELGKELGRPAEELHPDTA